MTAILKKTNLDQHLELRITFDYNNITFNSNYLNKGKKQELKKSGK